MPVPMAKMLGSTMTSVGSKPACSVSRSMGAVGDRDLPLDRVGLALLVEGHDDHRRAVAAGEPRLAQELVLALLERQRVDDRPALDVLEALLDDRPLRRVDHHRHLAMSGSAAIRSRKRAIAASESSSASSMLTSIIWAPFSTCWRAISTASSVAALLDQPREAREPVTLVRSPTLTNSESGPMSSGSRPDRRVLRLDVGIDARRQALDRRGDGARCGRASCRSSRRRG